MTVGEALCDFNPPTPPVLVAPTRREGAAGFVMSVGNFEQNLEDFLSYPQVYLDALSCHLSQKLREV